MKALGAARPGRRRDLHEHRLTRRVFWDLGIYMVGLGLLVGAVFPPFAILLGVDPQVAQHPTFVAACLVAGFLVGALNHGLSRVVVGRRLAVLSARLRLVADTITRANLSGEWADPASESSRINADSDDELGETARAFNSLLDALAAGEHSRSLVHNSSDIITVVDEQGRIRYLTPSVAWVLGLAPASLVGRQIRDLVHPDDVAALTGYLAVVADGSARQPPPVGMRMRHRDGSWRFVETAGKNLLTDPVVSGIVLTTRDVSERQELQERLRHQAYHDSLTGLPNRALFMDRVRDAQAELSGGAAPLAVLFVDLDNLKMVNDSFGHEGGDVLLTAVATRMDASTRPGDTVARLGGDEFAVLLAGRETACEAPVVAARLLADLSQPLLIAGRSVRPSVSIGVATRDGLGGAKDLVRAADSAMYAAKKAGKGRIEVFQPRHHAAEMDRQQLRADLQEALGDSQFVLHHQPIVDLVTGGITSFEALLRWQHPTRGLLPPAAFISLAEESDQILCIGREVLRQACLDASRWQRSGSRGAGVKVSVNISARQFSDPGLVAEVEDAVTSASLDPRLLTLELTETLLLRDTAVTMRRIAGLQELGVTLALDDFGTGYSSLSYLRRFPINMLKMDRSFLDDVPGNGQDEAVVRAIVDLSSTLNLQLVAEGVETGEQAAALAGLGCPFGQGYYFARPVPYEQVLELIASPALPVQRVPVAVGAGPPQAVEPVVALQRRYGA